jgi:hypothetical protein
MRLRGFMALVRRLPAHGGACGGCAHSTVDPATIAARQRDPHAAAPALSSTDGLCVLREIILSRGAGCARFEPRSRTMD